MQLQNTLRNLAIAERNKKNERTAIIATAQEIECSELMNIKGIGRKSAERLISR